MDILFNPTDDGEADEVPLASTFHSSTFSMELMESSETSITDCWYSLPKSMTPPPLPGVGVDMGMGVGPPIVP